MKPSELSFPEFERLAREGSLVPVWKEVRGDTETPVSAFLKLPSPELAFLLESAHPGESFGRYSFLGDRPLAHIVQRGQKTVIEEAGVRTESTSANPMLALRTLLAGRKMARAPGLPPFIGGLVGYLGWGAVRWFEPRVPQRHGPDPLFPDGEWMLAGRIVVFDNLTHTVRLIVCADVAKHGAAQAYRDARRQIDEGEAALRGPLPVPGTPLKMHGWEDGWSREGYQHAVERAKEYVAAGDCMQVVLSRGVRTRFEGDPFDVYRAMRRVSPTPYLFFLRFGARALAGASPELLVRLQDRKATVRPIAGTRRRGKTASEEAALEAELRADPKERAEHVMLVDLGRNDVGRVSEGGSVRVEEREVIERYSHVVHLVSQVSGTLRAGADAFDLLAATFPAGTVSGAPKVRAMEIIDELEPAPRGPYAGAAGYIGWDGSCDLAIAIRSVAMAGDELRIQAGAGIVHDSDPASEFIETEHKLGAPRAALQEQSPEQQPGVEP